MTNTFCLRDYQHGMVARIKDAWRNHRSVMVQMPTGTGKTHVLASVVNEELFGNEECRMKNEELPFGCRWKRKSTTNAGCVWIIAHRRELVTQIENTIQRMYAGLAEDYYRVSSSPNPTQFSSIDAQAYNTAYQQLEGNSSFFITRFGSSTRLHSSFPKSSSLIKVFSIQWLSRHWENVEGEPSLVIIDEAHHAVAETYKEMWNRWPKARFLGLTATPCRMNHRGFTDLFDTLICSWSIAEFIEKGHLSAFDYVSIRQGSEEQRLIDSLEKRGADGDYQTKEMNSVLNRDTSIERLYRSMELFATGKKGIVYAISIDHARKIAEYYSCRGVNAVPIDSRTPAAERKRMVEDFKAGRIQVLVNVDIFSEGFDCPDVEFVQMARPTLSLAKYLQQVGRGLRKSKGKETCVLIDNVGLYRVFGLPTVAWDWEAMFRGSLAGKAVQTASMRNDTGMTTIREEPAGGQEDGMEVIMSHEQLLADIGNIKSVCPMQTGNGELKAWKDVASGLWGLRRGRRLVTDARFINVFDIKYGMAAVRFHNKDCGIVNDAGEVVWKKDNCQSVRFMKDGLLYAKAYDKEYYVDIYSWRTYMQKPKVRKFGNVELLETGHTYHSRTKRVYVNTQGVGKYFIHWRKFYLTIYDAKVPFPSHNKEYIPLECYPGHACILQGDNESFYWLYYQLADGSIVVADNDGRYYHATEGKQKIYIGCRDSEEEWNRCRAEIEHLASQAEERRNVLETERIERRRQQLAQSDKAVPFRSGVRWGLKVGSRITIPPIYRRIKSPVGKYCAVEKSYSQWGVVALDGTVMVEPKYSDIEISTQGIVTGTKVTGSKELVRLP